MEKKEETIFDKAKNNQGNPYPLIRDLPSKRPNNIKVKHGRKQLPESHQNTIYESILNLGLWFDTTNDKKNEETFLINIKHIKGVLNKADDIFDKAKKKNSKETHSQLNKPTVPGYSNGVLLIKNDFNEENLKKYKVTVVDSSEDENKYSSEDSETLKTGFRKLTLNHRVENQFDIKIPSEIPTTFAKIIIKEVATAIKTDIESIKNASSPQEMIDAFNTILESKKQVNEQAISSAKILRKSNSTKNWTILGFGLTSVVLSGIVAYQNIPCIRALFKQS
jgi:sugar-specific transcriptional regulator TrmB